MSARDTPESLPAPFACFEQPDRVRYRLPNDLNRGSSCSTGLIPIGCGAVAGAFAAGLITLAILLFARAGILAAAGGIALVLLAAPLVWLVFVFLWAALFFWFGHTEVVLTGRKLTRIVCIGPLRWARSRATHDVQRLVMREKDDSASIEAACEARRALVLTSGYPSGLIGALADDLAGRWSSLTGLPPPSVESTREPSTQSQAAAAPVAVRRAARAMAGGADILPEQPSGSRVRLEQDADGLTLHIPRLGFGRNLGGLAMGTFFSGIGIVLIMSFIASLWFGQLPVCALCFFGLVAASGCGTGMLALFGTIRVATESSVLTVTGDRLAVASTNLVFSERNEWQREDIALIRAGPYETANDGIVEQLEIIPKSGAATELAARRDSDELEWIARLLRRRLELQTVFVSELDAPFEHAVVKSLEATRFADGSARLSAARVVFDAKDDENHSVPVFVEAANFAEASAYEDYSLSPVQGEAKKAVALLIESLTHEHAIVRWVAAKALGQLGRRAQQAVFALADMAGEEIPLVRVAAAEATRKIERWQLSE